MITDLPLYVYATFYGALIYALLLFYFASGRNWKLLTLIVGWGIFQSLLAQFGFYENIRTIPPRLLLLLFPIPVLVLLAISSRRVKKWMLNLSLRPLIWFHTVRIPVEIVLFWLFISGYVPQIMTFEGRNFDILAGISAPIVAIVSFKGKTINKSVLWIWHILSLSLLINILVIATLSTPTVLQQLAFEQPNIAVIKFPFLLLPEIIVPIVLISNLAGILILMKGDILATTLYKRNAG
jgi:hypothetical protein